MSIPRFSALVVFSAYCALLCAEYLRPGFVSTAMNVHVLWIGIVGCVVWEMTTKRAYEYRKISSLFLYSVMACIGMLLALIVWNLGATFGDMRLFFAVAVGILPSVLLIHEEK